MKFDKRILVLSFQPISTNSSNGRTVYNLFNNYLSKDNIFNFYIHGKPDNEKVSFFHVSDKDAIKSVFFVKPKFNIPQSVEKNDGDVNYRKRSNFKLFVRELVWTTTTMKKTLLEKAREIKPDAIFVLLGLSGFIMENALYLSKKLNVPLITFNCEDYYFKDYDYISFSKKKSIFHRLYKRVFTKRFDKLMRGANKTMYLTEDLERLYSSKFVNQNLAVIYNSSGLVSSNISICKNPSNHDFIYAGNLGNGRVDELIKIAKMIHEIDHDYRLVVYSNEIESRYADIIKKCIDVTYMGKLEYSEVLKKIESAYAIIHVDGTDPFYSKHTKHGFSTKIPDCLSSGNCLIVKASPDSTVYKYLFNNECAYVCSTDEDIKNVLENVIKNKDARLKYVSRAIKVAQKNHSLKDNSSKFYGVISEVISKFNL